MEQKKTFKPFERVLVRGVRRIWIPALYCFYDDEVGTHYTTEGYADCDDVIPFAGNETLVGTSDMPEEGVELKEGEMIVAFSCKAAIIYMDFSLCSFWEIQDDAIKTNTSSLYSFCIPFSKFDPNNMEETKKHILCVKNGKLVKVRV